jgi:hypothetical protein
MNTLQTIILVSIPTIWVVFAVSYLIEFLRERRRDEKDLDQWLANESTGSLLSLAQKFREAGDPYREVERELRRRMKWHV